MNMRCAACGDTSITNDHCCVESKYLKHYVNWLMLDNLDTIGHPLAYRVNNVQKFMPYFQDYARAVSVTSKERSRLHKLVCSAIDVDYRRFKPFESDLISVNPNYQLCLNILFSAVTNYLWTFTTIYRDKKYSYSHMINIRKKYISDNNLYPDIYLEEPNEH